MHSDTGNPKTENATKRAGDEPGRPIPAGGREWPGAGDGGPAEQAAGGHPQQTARLAIQDRIHLRRLEIWQLEELLKALPQELPFAADYALLRLLGQV